MSEKMSRIYGRGFLTWRWIRDFLVIIFLLVLSWRFAVSPPQFDLAGLGASEVVSILMSFFAIGLSVAFYFKATDTSNQFYDNVYKFTKDTSEILGRIEAGFGEKLRHIDEGYSGLRDRVDRIPFDIGEAKEKLSIDEKEVEKRIKERNQIIEDLAQKAKLQQSEKQRIISEMKEKDHQISFLKGEIETLAQKIETASSSLDMVVPGLDQFVLDRWTELYPTDIRNVPNSSHVVARRFKKLLGGPLSIARNDLRRFNVIDSEDELTPFGRAWIRDVFRAHKQKSLNFGEAKTEFRVSD